MSRIVRLIDHGRLDPQTGVGEFLVQDGHSRSEIVKCHFDQLQPNSEQPVGHWLQHGVLDDSGCPIIGGFFRNPTDQDDGALGWLELCALS